MPEGSVTGTFEDYSEENSEATEQPNNYEICQLSGFRVKPKDLVQRWDGLWVKREFWEPRHPQDFVRARPERPRASPSPGQTDVFTELSAILLTEDGAYLSLEATDGFLLTEAKGQISADDL